MPRDYPKFDGSQPCAQTDPELFFPTKGDTKSGKIAVKLCWGCNWRVQCFEYAIQYALCGIWGATTEKQRIEIQKKLGIKPIDVIIGGK